MVPLPMIRISKCQILLVHMLITSKKKEENKEKENKSKSKLKLTQKAQCEK